ncbi:MAG: matrixin family metalloprotease [Vicinamibacterales bacterium]
MRQPLTRFALLTAALIGTGIACPSAYVLNGPRWPVRTVNYYVNPANLDVPEAAAEAAVQAGAAVWGSQSAADFRFYYMGRTTGTALTNNGKNEVFFRNAASGGLIAETYWWADANARLIDADIVFYDGGFTFFTGSGCSGGIYIENTAAHEFGHALGLGHSADADATMYYMSSYCSTSGLSLNPDDLSGVEALYPPASANSAPGVTITAPSAGTAIPSGANVTLSATASDQQDGSLSAAIVWRSSLAGALGTGPVVSALLPIGDQTLTASVTDSAGATGTATVAVTVTAVPAGPIALTAALTMAKSGARVELRWSGAVGTNVDVYRNGSRLTTTANDGSDTDNLGKRTTTGSYLYTVCASGTRTCAPGVTVSF